MAFHAGTAEAQLRPVVVTDAHIITQAGPEIEKGSILIRDGRIADVGEKVDRPFLAGTVDAAGKWVTPGLIDAWSSLGVLGANGRGNPQFSVWDAFDRYNRPLYREALRNGVTAVYIVPSGNEGFLGKGTLVKLVPQEFGAAGKRIDAADALAISLASGKSPVSRAKLYYEIRAAFKKAKDYREALETYEEELKEYEEKLAERRKEKEKEGDSDKDKKKDKEKDEPKEEPKPDEPEPEDEPESEEDEPEESLNAGRANYYPPGRRPPVPPRPPKGDGKKDKGKNGDKEEEDDLKKPAKPKPDRESEALLETIDHKLAVRIEAHKSNDIYNAIELADEFGFDLIIEGGTEAYLMAEELAARDIPVILGSITRGDIFENNEYRRHSTKNAAMLTKAGVQWTVGSGAERALSTRFVGEKAQLAAGMVSAPDVSWLELVTTRAAGLLGLPRGAGRLVRGASADFVIWNGDPRDPASRVEEVYIDGTLAWRAGGGS